uniref:Rad60-SLD domain-containing protein n=1 Tax=Steinernema glaseri TaxID=37863 RepID=A0A1I7Z4Q0_9BILA
MIQLEDGYVGRYFLISPSYPFGSILNTYAGIEGQPRSMLEFVYNGNIINEYDTFFSLQMDYGAQIKVMCKAEKLSKEVHKYTQNNTA